MKIIVRYGELMLKGKNRKDFIKQVNNHLKNKYKNLEVKLDFKYDHLFIEFDESLKDLVVKKLKEVPGLHSFSIIYESTLEFSDILEKGLSILENELESNKEYRFKIETKRSNKRYHLTSLEFSQKLAPSLLKETNNKLVVDVRNPDVILNVNIMHDKAILFLNKELALGGFPAGIAGRGLVMMSGGIDSPVSAFLTIKQGVATELIHFESSPLTPLESINKVNDLAAKLALYLPNERIKLHIVPFFKIHEALLNNISDPFIITIMRRMMYRIAERYANFKKIDILINGESVGQVASQTLKSLKAVENVTNIPIIRPLATYDKVDIIKIAKDIDTYNISIQPFNDCCSIYVPKSPVINPLISECEFEESKYDFEPLIVKALEDIKTVIIKADEKLDFTEFGFTFIDAYNEMVKDRD